MTRSRHNDNRGSALLAALCFTVVLAVAVTGYLSVCYRSLVTSTRMLQSERGEQLANIGLEEALWALNKSDFSDFTVSGANYTKTTTGFSYENGITGRIVTTIATNTGAWSDGGARTVTVQGITTLADGTEISRRYETTVEPLPMFVNAIAGASTSDRATAQVRFYSAGSVDSYYSAVSTAPASFEYGAVVAANDKVTMASAGIKGYVAIDSATPTLTSPTSSATLKGPDTAASVKIDTTRLNGAVNQPFYSVNTPTGAGTTISAGTQTLGTSGATSPSLYYASDFNLSGSSKVTIDGPVQLVVSGDFSVQNSSSIEITTNGSLEIFVGGYTTINSSKGLINKTKVPAKFALYATNTIWTGAYISAPTSEAFYGVVYMPEKTIDIYGNGTYYGALVGKRVNIRANSTLHYDMSLRTAYFRGLATPYGITEREETTGQ